MVEWSENCVEGERDQDQRQRDLWEKAQADRMDGWLRGLGTARMVVLENFPNKGGRLEKNF